MRPKQFFYTFLFTNMYLLFAFQNQLKIPIIKVFTLNVKMSLRERFLNACWDSDLVTVKDCLEMGVDVNTVSEIYGHALSGLAVAAFKDYPELLDLLLSQPGINVNLPTRHSFISSEWTPLMFACQMRNCRHFGERGRSLPRGVSERRKPTE